MGAQSGGLEFIDDAIADLQGFSRSGHLPQILKKLSYIEQAPTQVGEPLSADLATLRKLTFGNRQWRIIFRPNVDGSGAVVIVIGNREDMECYERAKERVGSLAPGLPRKHLEEAIELLDHRLGSATNASGE